MLVRGGGCLMFWPSFAADLRALRDSSFMVSRGPVSMALACDLRCGVARSVAVKTTKRAGGMAGVTRRSVTLQAGVTVGTVTIELRRHGGDLARPGQAVKRPGAFPGRWRKPGAWPACASLARSADLDNCRWLRQGTGAFPVAWRACLPGEGAFNPAIVGRFAHVQGFALAVPCAWIRVIVGLHRSGQG